MSKHKLLVGMLGLAAAGIALGALANRFIAARKPLAAAPPQLAPAETNLPEELEDFPPDSSVFEPAPVSDRHVSARPQSYARRPASADDYDAISADELGSAFLARATDASTPNEEEYGDVMEDDGLVGFQIVQPRRRSK